VVRRGARFMELCRGLPAGHWHCRHGHLIDCPSPMTCPRLSEDDEPRTYVVSAGRMTWLYASERTARLQLRVLQSGRVEDIVYRRSLSALQVDLLLASLPDDHQVEDCR